jgi:hypothetical protein
MCRAYPGAGLQEGTARAVAALSVHSSRTTRWHGSTAAAAEATAGRGN